jgi:hypothetical protein
VYWKFGTIGAPPKLVRVSTPPVKVNVSVTPVESLVTVTVAEPVYGVASGLRSSTRIVEGR